MDNQLPLQLEPLPLSRDILHSFPTVGSILRVIIDQVNKKHVLHLLNTGKWMIFLNVLCQVNAGLWNGVLTHFTRLRYMPSEDPLILERQRWLLLYFFMQKLMYQSLLTYCTLCIILCNLGLLKSGCQFNMGGCHSGAFLGFHELQVFYTFTFILC
jgi:hypothetical protein